MTPVVLVVTPGVELAGYRPLLDALRDRDLDPEVVEFPCSGDFRALADQLHRRLAESPSPPVVVAHGLGATLALAAAPGLDVDRWVLLAPILAVPHSAAVTSLGDVAPGARVDLSVARPWANEPDLRRVLLGADPPALGCFPAALARDLQGWIATGTIPLALAAIGDPVWIGVGLLDELAPVEVVIPASRALPDRRLVRLGVTHFDPVDYDHAAMLGAVAPVRAAIRAVLERDPP